MKTKIRRLGFFFKKISSITIILLALLVFNQCTKEIDNRPTQLNEVLDEVLDEQTTEFLKSDSPLLNEIKSTLKEREAQVYEGLIRGVNYFALNYSQAVSVHIKNEHIVFVPFLAPKDGYRIHLIARIPDNGESTKLFLQESEIFADGQTDSKDYHLTYYSLDYGINFGNVNNKSFNLYTKGDDEDDDLVEHLGGDLPNVTVTAPKSNGSGSSGSSGSGYGTSSNGSSNNGGNSNSSGGSASNGYGDSSSNANTKPPSCKSFKFKGVAGNWQAAVVKGIRFKIRTLTKHGPRTNIIVHDIQLYSSVQFETFKVDRHDSNVSAGLAATISAAAVHQSMRETARDYADKVGFSSTQIRLHFEARLKTNFAQMSAGGRVRIGVNSYKLPATNYQTEAFGFGDCN